MNAHQPIGFFDSGIGGVTIWKEVHKVLPNESTIYLADSKNAPYGQKSTDEIIALSVKNTEWLLSKNVKLIVVACNTATTNAIKYLRSHYDIPFIGIEPAIKPAALLSKTKSIGVLATKGTLSSEVFHKALLTHNEVKIINQIGHGLVQLIEEGKKDSEEMQELLRLYLQPMIDQNIDHLVLGCTHYPFLIPQIQKILPPSIHIIDSGLAVAKQTKNILEKHHLLQKEQSEVTNIFYINQDKNVLEQQILNNQFLVIEEYF